PPGLWGPHAPPPEPHHRRLERQPGARRRLIAECRHDLAVEPRHESMGLALDLFGSRKQLFEHRPRELLALDHVREPRTDGNQKAPVPASRGPDLKEPRRTCAARRIVP